MEVDGGKNMDMKPYTEEENGNIVRRTFSSDVSETELTWHRDHEDRVVLPINENDWYLQMDNELPKKLDINEEYFIPKNTYHRVIKGSTDLMVEVIKTIFEKDEYELYGVLEEGKKKKKKKDACYYKVKSRYDVWPSAYGSSALVKCRKVGAKNWGNKTNESKEEFQNRALDKINKVGGFESLPDIDKLALLGGSDNEKLMFLNLSKIFKENGGTFGKLEIKVKVKDLNKQPINHKFSKEFAGKEGYLFPYINYDDNEPYVTIRFDEFVSDPKLKGGGNYEERPIYLKNIYPIDYDEIKSDFVKYQNKIDFERDEFLKFFDDESIDEAKKTDFSKEKEKGLHGWFERQGGKGKSQGWVDCNTCRKDPGTGRKKCKPCGREEGEDRKYPACRPTPASCGTKGKGKKWGKKSNESLQYSEKNTIFAENIKDMILHRLHEMDTSKLDLTTLGPVKEPVVLPETKPAKPSPRRKRIWESEPAHQPKPKM